MTDRFDGRGFNESPIEGKEAARHRHMFHVLEENWIEISPEVLSSMKGVDTVLKAIAIIYKVIRIGGPVILFAALAGAWLKSQGFLG